MLINLTNNELIPVPDMHTGTGSAWNLIQHNSVPVYSQPLSYSLPVPVPVSRQYNEKWIKLLIFGLSV
jgi:hypothetical protein